MRRTFIYRSSSLSPHYAIIYCLAVQLSQMQHYIDQVRLMHSFREEEANVFVAMVGSVGK